MRRVSSGWTAGRCSAWCRRSCGANGTRPTTGIASAGDASAARARQANACSSTRASATRRTTQFREHSAWIGGGTWITRSPMPALAPDDIDIVLATHLHFDHAGGFTVRDRGWPAASPISARALCRAPRRVGGRDASADARNRGNYLPDDFLPLMSSGRARTGGRRSDDHAGREGETHGRPYDAPPDGLIESNGQRAAFPADLMPTAAHLSAGVDCGGRPVPARDAGLQAGVRGGGGSASRRSSSSITNLGFRPRASSNRTAGDPFNPYEHTVSNHRHHRRQRPVRHGGADRPRREAAHDAVRRSVGRLRPRPRCADGASRFSRATAPATASFPRS